jgi:hypothetical protein
MASAKAANTYHDPNPGQKDSRAERYDPFDVTGLHPDDPETTTECMRNRVKAMLLKLHSDHANTTAARQCVWPTERVLTNLIDRLRNGEFTAMKKRWRRFTASTWNPTGLLEDDVKMMRQPVPRYREHNGTDYKGGWVRYVMPFSA